MSNRSRNGRVSPAAAALTAVALYAAGTPFGLDAQQEPSHRDIVYATVDGVDLALELYMPSATEPPPLLVWVHGGAWRSFTKESVPKQFVENGIATSSLDFRQTTEAPFPANVHDIKAAIRFLREQAAEYGYRADRIAIAGNSSGGHLAALVGVTNGHAELEGSVGNASGSSDVQRSYRTMVHRTLPQSLRSQRRWG